VELCGYDKMTKQSIITCWTSSSSSSSFTQMTHPGAVFFTTMIIMFILPLLAAGQQGGDWQENYDGSPLGCEARKLCCTGRDSSCVVSEFHPNSIIEDLDTNRTIRCYCDESCLTLGDCCHDLRSYCGGNLFYLN
jgi:hypothetical protein